MLEIEQLEHRYAGTPVLQLAHWRAEPGQQWLLSGPSGSGKSTLLHIIAGLLRPSTGRVLLEGEDLTQLGAARVDKLRGRLIGIILQRLHLVPGLTVLDNLLLAQYLAGLKADRDAALEMLQRLGIAGKADVMPHTLSFGQSQRVAIARALLNRPHLILADEPTSGLDDVNCAEVGALLREQAQACNATLIVATHDGRLHDDFSHLLDLSTAA